MKTDWKDDIFTRRKLRMVDNGDGTVTPEDATDYTQRGDSFGAKELNTIGEEVNEIKKSVSDGKTLVAAAITAKKVATAATASFAEMAENIKKIVLGSGTARAADVLAGKTFTNNDGVEYTGTMPERGKWNGSLGTSGSITIPAGHHSGQGKVSAATQTALTLNPGTTQKTAYVYQKYMLGNITVPAISIPAAYIKKGQRITFPDGSSVVGTFEGWVPVATDLYYNGQNVAGFEPNNINTSDYASFDNNQISITGVTILKFKSTITYDVRSYSKFIIEGNIIPYASSSTVTITPNNGQQKVSASFSGAQSQIVVDITALTSLNSTWYLEFAEGTSSGKINKGSYIRRIRLA